MALGDTPAGERLLEAARERRLMPFVGAGFSKNLNNSFPSWDELIDIAAELLGYEPGVLRAQGDAYQIAEALNLESKLHNFYELVEAKLHPTTVSVGDSTPHQLLARIDCSSVFTTNWDNWIERAFEAEGTPFRKVAAAADLQLVPPRMSSTSVDSKSRVHRFTDIIKLHGDFSKSDTIVFRESDFFERMRLEGALDVRLRSEIFENSVVFIGYSFTDMDIRLIWHKLDRQLGGLERRQRPNSFFVTFGDFGLQRRLLDQQRIEMISIEPLDKRTSLTEFLREITDAQ